MELKGICGVIGAVGVLMTLCTFAIAQDEPPSDVKDLITDCIKFVLSQKGYRVRFQTKTEIPRSDVMKVEGTATVINPDTVYVFLEGSGGQKREIVRKGEKVLIKHPIVGEWVPPEEMGEGNIGKGIHNPDKVLGTLEKYRRFAKLVKSSKTATEEYKEVVIEFKGEEIGEILKEQQNVDPSAICWDKSELVAKFFIRSASLGSLPRRPLVYKIVISSVLWIKEDSHMDTRPEKIIYEATIELVDINTGLDLREVPREVKKELGIS